MLAVLANGRVASGSQDRTVKVWNPETAESELSFEPSSGWASALLALPDGRLAVSCFDGTIELWNLATQEIEAALEGHGTGVKALVALPNSRLASGHGDGSIKLWDLLTAKTAPAIGGHRGQVSGIVFVSKGRFASASWDSTIRLWNPPATEPESTFLLRYWWAEAPLMLQSVALLPDGRLACGTNDGVQLLNLKTGQAESNLRPEGFVGGVGALFVLRDGRLASGFEDNIIRLWNIETGKSLMRPSKARHLRGLSDLLPRSYSCPTGGSVRVRRIRP